MANKDLIIRASGNLDEVKLLLEEVALEISSIGVECDDLSIRHVPTKLSKTSLQNKKARDLKISVMGPENSVESFIDAVTDFIEKDLGLSAPSTILELPKE